MCPLALGPDIGGEDSPYALQHETDAKHTPVISAPAEVKVGVPFAVTIKADAEQHPSLVDHLVESDGWGDTAPGLAAEVT